MKAAINGVLNVSILDGWWDEGYTEERGWQIGNGEEYEDHGYQDAIESQALYNVLENEIIPCFYDRKNGNPPTCWIKKMKASMKMAMESFCSLRMVSEYESRYYIPAARRWDSLIAEEADEAKKLAAQIKTTAKPLEGNQDQFPRAADPGTLSRRRHLPGDIGSTSR